MSFQSQVSPHVADHVPFWPSLRKLFTWLKQPPIPEAEAPKSERLRRDARLPMDSGENADRRAAQVYCDRHMTLL